MRIWEAAVNAATARAESLWTARTCSGANLQASAALSRFSSAVNQRDSARSKPEGFGGSKSVQAETIPAAAASSSENTIPSRAG
jgi:hypothetical protein